MIAHSHTEPTLNLTDGTGELDPPLELKLDSTITIAEGESWPRLLDSPKELLLPRNDFQSLVDEMVANPTACACSMHDDSE